MDEVLAVTAAEQVGVSGVYRAIWAGTDFSPPSFHLMLHALPGLATHTRIVARLWSIGAGLLAGLCMYVIARRRFDASLAAVAFGVTLASPLFDYAVQARQYALTTFLLAAALAFWDRLPAESVRDRLSLTGLWAALAACVSLHFYGLVAVGAVLFCEALWTVVNRTIRWRVWGTLAAVGPVFLAWLPLASHLRTFSGYDQLAPAYYGHPTLTALYHAFIDLAVGGRPQMIIYGGVVFAILVSAFWPRAQAGEMRSPAVPKLDSNLVIMMVALALIPLGAFLLGKVATGSFVSRYALGVTLLPGLAIGGVLHATPRAAWAALLAVPFVILSLVIQDKDNERAAAILAALGVVNEGPRAAPLLIGDGLHYVEMVGDLPAAISARINYLAKPKNEISPDPTNENEIRRLAGFDKRFHLVEFDEATHSNGGFYFLTASPGGIDVAFTTLVRDHANIRLVEDAGAAQLYFVDTHKTLPNSEP